MHTFETRHQLGTLLFVHVSSIHNMVHNDLCMCHSQARDITESLEKHLKKCCLRERETLATLFCAFTKHFRFSINKALSAQQRTAPLLQKSQGALFKVFSQHFLNKGRQVYGHGSGVACFHRFGNKIHRFTRNANCQYFEIFAQPVQFTMDLIKVVVQDACWFAVVTTIICNNCIVPQNTPLQKTMHDLRSFRQVSHELVVLYLLICLKYMFLIRTIFRNNQEV